MCHTVIPKSVSETLNMHFLLSNSALDVLSFNTSMVYQKLVGIQSPNSWVVYLVYFLGVFAVENEMINVCISFRAKYMDTILIFRHFFVYSWLAAFP